MAAESEGREPPPQRVRTSTETPLQDFERQKAAIAREEATTRLLDKLTELTELARHFLHEMVERALAEDAATRRRREERARAMHERQMGR